MTGPEPAAGSRLDPFVGSYAERSRSMVASEIRALFAVASRPEVVSLAGGMPNLSALPLDAVAGTFGRLVAEHGTQALQYGSGQGDTVLRDQIAGQLMPLVGVRAHPDDIVVTVGSQQALDLVTRVLCDPGDVVLAEAPSYVGALSVFAAYQARVVHVPMDAEGLLIVMVGRMTRLCAVATAFDKEYLATFTFGTGTDTLDPEGAVTGNGGWATWITGQSAGAPSVGSQFAIGF